MTRYLTALLLGVLSFTTHAQDSCQVALVKATESFDRGEYAQVISLLERRLGDCDFNRDAMLQAMKLLAASYDELDEAELAEATTRRFIRQNPVYTVQGIDPQAFATTFSKFDVKPRFSAGLNIGTGKTLVHVMKQYEVWDAAGYHSAYSTSYHVSGNASLQWHVTRAISLCAEIGFSMLNYEHDISYGNTYSLNYSENLVEFKTPLYVNYNFHIHKKLWVGLTSGAYAYTYAIISSTLKYTYDGNTAKENSDEVAGRRSYGMGLVEGLKLSYRMNPVTVSLESRHNINMTVLNKPGERYADPSTVANQLHVNDDLRLSTVELLLGVSYTFSYRIRHKYH